MTPSIRQIRAALVTYLKSLDLGGSVTMYAGQVEAALLGTEIEAPAQLVGYGGKVRAREHEVLGKKVFRVTFFVVIVVRNFSGGPDAYAAADSGADDVTDVVSAAVDGKDLGLDGFFGLEYESDSLVLSQPTRVAYRLIFSTLMEA